MIIKLSKSLLADLLLLFVSLGILAVAAWLTSWTGKPLKSSKPAASHPARTAYEFHPGQFTYTGPTDMSKISIKDNKFDGMISATSGMIAPNNCVDENTGKAVKCGGNCPEGHVCKVDGISYWHTDADYNKLNSQIDHITRNVELRNQIDDEYAAMTEDLFALKDSRANAAMLPHINRILAMEKRLLPRKK